MNLRSELLLLRRDRAVVIAVLIFTGLCLLATINGIRWRANQEASQQQAARSEEAEYTARKAQVVFYQTHPPSPLDPVLLNLHDPTSPYVLGQAGRMLHISIPALAAACVGQFDFLPLQELVSIRTRQRTVADKDGLENPLQLLTGRFDLAFNVVYLLPLFILALTYNIVSLEREEGTLGLLRSQPTFIPRLMLAKAGLRVLLLLIPPCFVIFLLPGIFAQPIRVAFWILAVAAYGIFWWSLAIWINSFHKDSTTNATVLALCWLLFVAIIPAALQIGVTALHPPPSRLELLAAVRDQSIDQRRDGKTLAAAWYSEHPEMLAAGKEVVYDTSIAGTMTHIEQDRRTLPLEEQFDASLAKRQSAVSSFRFLSPAVLIYEAMQDSAGTGIFRHRHYKAQLKTFRQQWLVWFHPRIFGKTVLRPADYDAMPRFQYHDETTGDWVTRVTAGTAALIAVSIVLIASTMRRL